MGSHVRPERCPEGNAIAWTNVQAEGVGLCDCCRDRGVWIWADDEMGFVDYEGNPFRVPTYAGEVVGV